MTILQQIGIRHLLNKETASGLFLLISALFALFMSNSLLSDWYTSLQNQPISLSLANFELSKSLLFWVNDGLMVIFFFYIGLEIKREIMIGELASVKRALLPVIGAFGGMMVPALIFFAVNYSYSAHYVGWAVPTATDIAFALGILMMLGPAVPSSLKLLLLSISVIDDIGAIAIIAIYYTANLTFAFLLLGLMAFLVLLLMNQFGVKTIWPYLFVGFIVWVGVLNSGVHATLAGVLVALTIPMFKKDGSPLLKGVERLLKPWVGFLILPVFAFFNAGVSFADISLNTLSSPLPLGIMLGLFFGKQIGVFLFTWASVKAGLCSLPSNVTWLHIYGISCLAGIGFTMSLYIGTLAFETFEMLNTARLGVMMGSGLSTAAGLLVLGYCFSKERRQRRNKQAGCSFHFTKKLGREL